MVVVLGNPGFVHAMKFCGVSHGFTITSPSQAQEVFAHLHEKHLLGDDELILVNAFVMEMMPALKKHPHLVTFPNSAQEFADVDDLRHIVRDAVGIEVKE